MLFDPDQHDSTKQIQDADALRNPPSIPKYKMLLQP
jgi:hypothetical protein